jgi:hypothetical protein
LNFKIYSKAISAAADAEMIVDEPAIRMNEGAERKNEWIFKEGDVKRCITS